MSQELLPTEATEEVQVRGSHQESLFSKWYSKFGNQDQNREKRGSNGEQMATGVLLHRSMASASGARVGVIEGTCIEGGILKLT